MGIAESYHEHLAGSSDPGRLARDLYDAGLYLEAGLVGGADDERPGVVTDPSTWLLGRRLWREAFPPRDAAAGDVWFDPYELTAMVLCPREPMLVAGPPPNVSSAYDTRLAWLATRPVLNFQFAAFLALAPLEHRSWEGPGDLGLFDPRRLDGPPAAPVTGATRGEAHLYARWFGKSLPSTSAWVAARMALPAIGWQALWSRVAREWTSTSPVEDPDIGVAVGQDTVDFDPDEIDLGDDEWLTPDAHESLFGPWDRADDVGFRTSVVAQIGLLHPAAFDGAVAVADVSLRAPLTRTAPG